MNIKVKNWTIQWIWWWRWPTFKWWAWPTTYKKYEAMKGKPIFWGLYFGIFEIRFIPPREFT